MQDFLIIINSNTTTKDKINSLLQISSHKMQIEFALYCAKYSYKYIDLVKNPELKAKVDTCLELIADYLLRNKVSSKKLKDAAYAAYAANATYAAAYAANAAAYAAYAAANAAANAANAAAYAAAYAAYAAACAANATYAAAYAANAAENNIAIEHFYNYLCELYLNENNINNKENIKLLYL